MPMISVVWVAVVADEFELVSKLLLEQVSLFIYLRDIRQM